MKIVLKDHRSRRLPIPDQVVVDNQVDEWLRESILKESFTMTLNKRDMAVRVSKWALCLQKFDYEIEHRSGAKMRHVDALSRASCLMIEDSLGIRSR